MPGCVGSRHAVETPPHQIDEVVVVEMMPGGLRGVGEAGFESYHCLGWLLHPVA